MESLSSTIETALWNMVHRLGPKDILDILVVAVLIYELIMLTRQTRSSAVLKGMVLLVLVTLVSNLMGLTALKWIMNSLLTYGALVLIILFQPELRKALEQIGRSALMDTSHRSNADDNERIIGEIIQCATNLSRRRVGALIAFERKTGLKDVIETGTVIDAQISAPLLENIFEPNTPLHDGAVIIRGSRVVAGACIIHTLTENRVAKELGTRHRAAIGLSETTDALVLVVSEETGTISLARDGRLSRHQDIEGLRKALSEIYTSEPHHGLSSLSGMFQGKEAQK